MGYLDTLGTHMLGGSADALVYQMNQANNPWSGFPEDVPYTASWSPGMAMAPDISGRLARMEGLDRFKREALRTGPSAWSNLAKKQTFQDEALLRDRATGSASGNLATARSNLAMRGGLSSGARERLEAHGADSLLSAGQDISAQGAQNRMQIGMNDEQNRIAQLGILPGMEMDPLKLYGQARQFDIGNESRNLTGLNAYNIDNLGQKRSAWAADKTAQAQEAAANSGTSFLCTEFRKRGLMSKRESVIMTRFMLRNFLRRADFFAWYFREAPQAIEVANRQNFDWSKIKDMFVGDVIKLMKTKGDNEAADHYARETGKFIRQFLGSRCTFREGLASPGLIKSLVAIPVVFSRPCVWKWLYGYAKSRVGRKFVTLRTKEV